MINKAGLLEAIAGKNRGLLATETDKIAILSAITRLEEANPTPRPLEAADLLEGNWRLLYTSSKGILNLNQFPLLELGQVYQYLRTTEQKVYNIAEFVGIPYLEGIVSVCARFEPVSERRVNVRFERSISGLQRFLGYQSPDNFIQQIESGKKFTALDFDIKSRDQQGWLEITYLDSDLRIGRGNRGNVFVQAKA